MKLHCREVHSFPIDLPSDAEIVRIVSHDVRVDVYYTTGGKGL